MKNRLRGVCAGAGYFSRYQYEAWNRIPEVEISAICNRSVEKAQTIAAEFRIPRVYGYDRFEEMLEREQPDFVDIITPPSTHLELCRIAARYPVTIICQKPLAPTYPETLELAAVVRSAKGRFMVHENWRWQPWYREMKRWLDAGRLGEPFHIAVQTRLGDGWGPDAYLARQPFFREYPRLFIFETGVHFLDTFRFLLGEPESVYARVARRNPVIKGEDSAVVVCGFPAARTALLDANRYNESEAADPRYTFGRVRLDGSEGHLELDWEGTLQFKPLGRPPETVDYHPSRQGFAGDCVYAIQRHFTDCMLAGCDCESTIDDYLRSVRLVEAAYASAASGQVVQLEGWEPAAETAGD